MLTIVVGTILFLSFSCDCSIKSRKAGIAKTDTSIVTIPDEKIIDQNKRAADSVALMNREAVREKLNASPVILYFGINQSEISLDQTAKQSRLAYPGKWEELKKWQNEMIGGKE